MLVSRQLLTRQPGDVLYSLCYLQVRHSGNIVGHCKLGHFDILRARSVDFTAEELLRLFPGLSEGVTCVTFEFEWGQLYLG